MKHLTFIFLITFISNTVIKAQVPDQQKQRQSWDALKDTSLRTPPQNKGATFKDYPLNFKLSKDEFKQQRIIDSLFISAYKFLPYASQNNYDRIVVRVTKGGLFSGEKISIIEVKKTIEVLQNTGKAKLRN